jgi:uncharacterized membrane protein
MSDIAMTNADAVRAKPAGLVPLIASLAINFVGPYIVYSLAEPRFPADSTMPLLLSALVPATEFSFVYFRKHTVDVIAIISLVQLIGGIVITLLAHTAHAAIIGHALMPAALGLVFAASIPIGRPLLQPLARQTMAGGDVERQARFDEISKHPNARRTFVRLTWVWAIAQILNSAILIAAAYSLSNRNYVLVSPVITYGIIGLLIWGGITYGRRAMTRAMAHD